MRKKIVTLLILVVVIVLSHSVLKLFIKSHNIIYKVNNNYEVEEHYQYSKNNHQYSIIIRRKNNNYSYILNNNLHKKKKIIKEIKTFKNKNLTCIIPIYKKNISLKSYCSINNRQVSNSYLIMSNNEEYNLLLDKLKKYNINIYEKNTTKTKYKQLKVYQKNILKGYTFILWNYKGIYLLNGERLSYKKFLNYDLYDNIMSTVVSEYYVLFDNSSVNGIDTIYYYNLKKDKLKKITLKKKLSKDSYINGVVNKLIYITDRNEKKQYTIDIKREKIEELENKNNNYTIYNNNKRKYISKSDYFLQDQLFNNKLITNKITKSKLLKKDNIYYYMEDNKFYKVLNISKDNPILLFEIDNINNWMVVNYDILVISDNTLYLYNDDSGLQKILESNEIKYNYQNIINLWKE